MGDYHVRDGKQRQDGRKGNVVDGGGDWIFGGMARVSKGKKRPPTEDIAGGRCAFRAPLTWLFLIGLRPRRARLRFTKHNYCRTSKTKSALGKNTKPGLDTRAVMGVPFSIPSFPSHLRRPECRDRDSGMVARVGRKVGQPRGSSAVPPAQKERTTKTQRTRRSIPASAPSCLSGSIHRRRKGVRRKGKHR